MVKSMQILQTLTDILNLYTQFVTDGCILAVNSLVRLLTPFSPLFHLPVEASHFYSDPSWSYTQRTHFKWASIAYKQRGRYHNTLSCPRQSPLLTIIFSNVNAVHSFILICSSCYLGSSTCSLSPLPLSHIPRPLCNYNCFCHIVLALSLTDCGGYFVCLSICRSLINIFHCVQLWLTEVKVLIVIWVREHIQRVVFSDNQHSSLQHPNRPPFVHSCNAVAMFPVTRVY